MALSVLFTVEQRDLWRTSIDPASTAVSGDGRYVAFVSFSQLAPADADRLADVYVLDRARQQVTLESVETTGPVSVVADPRLSGDGRILVYQRDDKITVRNRTANSSTIVGTGRQPTVSHDGSTVAFVSERDVYVVRLGTAELLRVSIAMPGLESIVTASVAPSMSEDGRYVAFASRAAQRPQNQTPTSYIFIRDTHTNITKRISTGWGPAMSGDSRFVTFLDYARSVPHVFLADVAAGTVRAVTNNTRGRLANGGSANPGVSFDGRYVVFQSDANDLTEGEDYNLLPDVFIFDRREGVMSRVSGDPDEAWLEPSGGPSIDDRGSVVAFSSRHPTDASDKRNDFDLYVATFRQVSDDHLNIGLASVR
jgi:Tol biopolymer transport system component